MCLFLVYLFAFCLTSNTKATGPISFATYMQLCLSHPTEGYYMNPTNPVFGARGDFITSPEISQVFGEVRRTVVSFEILEGNEHPVRVIQLIGLWLLSQWMNAGRSPGFRLIELGPGRGTLIADFLHVSAFYNIVRRRGSLTNERRFSPSSRR
jgi:NADH dehydrogenase [ubiquinone] 1 alpha subcomplex assembly factor 7